MSSDRYAVLIRLFSIGILLLVGVLLWLPTYYFGFGQEEFRYFHDYSAREMLKGCYSHWEPSLKESIGYRPGHAIHIWFFYRLIGVSPENNHLIQLFFSSLFSVLFFSLTMSLTASVSTAFWATFIYLCLGNTAWQVAQIVNRQHLILMVSCTGMLLLYLLYLRRGKRIYWICSYLAFLGGLLVKETALTFPFLIIALGVVVTRTRIKTLLSSCWPFFLTLAIFLVARYFATREAAAVSDCPPPAPLNPVWMVHQYLKSIIGALIPVQGTRGYEVIPSPDEFSNWTPGFTIGASALALFAGAGLLLSLKRGATRVLAFGAITYLGASVLVAAWYRTNRFFISDLGLCLCLGIFAAQAFAATGRKGGNLQKILGGSAILGLLGYLGANLSAYQVSLDVLRPEGIWIVDHCAVELVNNHEYIPEEMEQLMIEKLRLYGDLPGTWRARKERADREQVPPEYPY